MKHIKNSVTLVAFVVASFGAFAFNSPQEDSANIKRALNPETQEWVDISGQVEGQDYQCDLAETICTAEFNQSGQMIPNSQTEGEFVEL